MKHIFYKCSPDKHKDDEYYNGCQFCDGGLAACTVCNGFEGSLTTECYGKPLNDYLQAAVYKGGLDFKNGKWIINDK